MAIENIFIIAGGPSAAGHDYDLYKNKVTMLGVNDGGIKANTPTIVSMDGRWMKNRYDAMQERGVLLIGRRSSFNKHLGPDKENKLCFLLDVDHERGDICQQKWKIHARNSGFMALNFAYYLNPKKIFLFGLDYNMTGDQYWYPIYEWKNRVYTGNYKLWRDDCNHAKPVFDAAGIEVYNVSRASMVTAYPRIDFHDIKNILK